MTKEKVELALKQQRQFWRQVRRGCKVEKSTVKSCIEICTFALEDLEQLQSDLDKYKEAEKFVDDPPHDQECCGCVAILRKQKADLQAELDKAIMKNTKSLLEIGGLQAQVKGRCNQCDKPETKKAFTRYQDFCFHFLHHLQAIGVVTGTGDTIEDIQNKLDAELDKKTEALEAIEIDANYAEFHKCGAKIYYGKIAKTAKAALESEVK